MSLHHRSGALDVGGQNIHWEETGTPAGIPALYLHGGPGSGLGDGSYVDRFNLDAYRVVGMDQRGCGRSHPLAGQPGHDLSSNTTQRLIADIELLRDHLDISAWVVNGVSWGSTLALAYAQAHPQRVLGIVLMAVTTTSAEEVHWITEGCQTIYPEAWDALASFVEERDPEYERNTTPIVATMLQLLSDPDAMRRSEAARAWGRWEDTHVAIAAGGYFPSDRWGLPDVGVTVATLITHYWSNHAFLDPPILLGMDGIKHVPGYLIHGRRDISGPAHTAWLLHQQWPGSELLIVEDEGHGGPRMIAAWGEANAALAERLRASG